MAILAQQVRHRAVGQQSAVALLAPCFPEIADKDLFERNAGIFENFRQRLYILTEPDLVQQATQNIVLIGDVVVDAGLVDPRAGADVADRGRGEAFFEKQLERRIANLFAPGHDKRLVLHICYLGFFQQLLTHSVETFHSLSALQAATPRADPLSQGYRPDRVQTTGKRAITGSWQRQKPDCLHM